MHCSMLETSWAILLAEAARGDNLRELTIVYPYIIRCEGPGQRCDHIAGATWQGPAVSGGGVHRSVAY